MNMFKNNKILGSVFIVSGTAIGGGMVAMPIVLSGVGFITSTLILLMMWGLMCYSALLMVELYQYHSPCHTPTQIAEYYLGKPGKIILLVSMLTMMFALIAAYIAGGGELFQVIGGLYFDNHIPGYIYSILMIGILAIFLVLGTNKVDILNKLLFTLKISVLILILFSMLSFVRVGNLDSLPDSNFVVLVSLPLIFTAFGFHTCIQSLEIYLEGNRSKVRKVMIIGSVIPLIVYVFWMLVILGSLDSATLNGIIRAGGGVDSISLTIRQLLGNPYIEIGVKVFVLLAILTSFLGVSLGAFDYISTGLKINEQILGRLTATIITFFIPVLFVAFYPKGFLKALGFAAIAFSLMTLVIPSLMVWQERKITPYQLGNYRVKGGNIGLLAVFLAGCLIIGIQILVFLDYLPKIG
ncbi:MAG: tyrosine transporter TyrP [Neisseriaceae bacterium]|nr:MAG: tyrosine transporter TyrP [Neisseriaceae bacterium]